MEPQIATKPPLGGVAAGADVVGATAVGPLAGLVRVAVGSDDPAGLLAAAGRELGEPVGLAGARGEPLGHAPDDVSGRRALAVAAAASRTRASAPKGWRVLAIHRAGARVASFAAGEPGDAAPEWSQLVELVATLLGDQLARAALRWSQAAAFVARLLHEPGLPSDRALEEGAAAGVSLAPAYWAAVLACPGVPPRPETFERIGRQASQDAPGALNATLDGHLVLLHPHDAGGAAPMAWLEHVVAHARSLAPGTRAHAIAGQAPVGLGELSGHVAELVRLSRLGTRPERATPVVLAGRFALDRLLWDNLAPADARGFVEDRLGPLLAWDREHGSDLVRVLEAALDFPRHDRAASRCFMHRNTFRHRLKQATDVLGADLDDPDVRLAVHVALKLRRGLPAPSVGAATVRRRTARVRAHQAA